MGSMTPELWTAPFCFFIKFLILFYYLFFWLHCAASRDLSSLIELGIDCRD